MHKEETPKTLLLSNETGTFSNLNVFDLKSNADLLESTGKERLTEQLAAINEEKLDVTEILPEP